MPSRTEENEINLPSWDNDNDIRASDDLRKFGYHNRSYVDSYRPSNKKTQVSSSIYPSPELSREDTVHFNQLSASHAESCYEDNSANRTPDTRKRSRDDDDLAIVDTTGNTKLADYRNNKVMRRDSGTVQSSQALARTQTSAGTAQPSHASPNDTRASADTNNKLMIGTLKPLTKPKNFPQPLTCYFWANSCCSKSDEDCWYAHYDTGYAAAAPIALASSGASLAGRGAEKVLEVTNAQRLALVGKQETLKVREDHLKSREKEMLRREEKLKKRQFVVNKLYEKSLNTITDTIVYLETRQNRAYPCEVNLRGLHRPVHRRDKPIYNFVNNTIDKLSGLEHRLNALKQ